MHLSTRSTRRNDGRRAVWRIRAELEVAATIDRLKAAAVPIPILLHALVAAARRMHLEAERAGRGGAS